MDSKQKICKICNKRYANGKALGGHMRSHLAKLPLPLPPPKPNQPSVVSSTSPSLDELSQEFSSVVEDAILESENENENESRRRHVTRQRSKRRRRSETFSAEEAAFFLVKLSKDKWDKREAVGHHHEEEVAKFKCETCNKVFGSYQALGGHKANHKKMMKSEISDDDEDNYESTDEEDGNEGRNNNYAVVDDHPIRTFECPFCFKVFGSGQALGGHKKVHFSNNLPIITRISSRKFGNSLIIDLNLPAVADEEVE
ncbi:Zinc finger protein ZAT9 [Morus notabilis]|uniref:Zinc finger protein ZAT9 n=1 Tax=Morus notabilis TaxID=981085 RepID=W9S446_9ROSA|nr:Zinc finger protein ZAT9 [Morus notabilis]